MPTHLFLKSNNQQVAISPLAAQQAASIVAAYDGKVLWARKVASKVPAISPQLTDYGAGVVVGYCVSSTGTARVLLDCGGATSKNTGGKDQKPAVEKTQIAQNYVNVFWGSTQPSGNWVLPCKPDILHYDAAQTVKPQDVTGVVSGTIPAPATSSHTEKAKEWTGLELSDNKSYGKPVYPHKCPCGSPALDLFCSTECSNPRCPAGNYRPWPGTG